MRQFKPCPFCGNDAPLIQHIEPHRHSFAIGLPDHGGSCVIECGGCDLAFLKGTEDEAVAAWNRRHYAQGRGMSKAILPEPFILVADQPWGGHAEVVRGARGGDGVIDCYSCEQMQSYADQVRAETLLEAQQAAQIAVDTLRNNGKETEAFFAGSCVDAIKRIMR